MTRARTLKGDKPMTDEEFAPVAERLDTAGECWSVAEVDGEDLVDLVTEARRARQSEADLRAQLATAQTTIAELTTEQGHLTDALEEATKGEEALRVQLATVTAERDRALQIIGYVRECEDGPGLLAEAELGEPLRKDDLRSEVTDLRAQVEAKDYWLRVLRFHAAGECMCGLDHQMPEDTVARIDAALTPAASLTPPSTVKGSANSGANSASETPKPEDNEPPHPGTGRFIRATPIRKPPSLPLSEALRIVDETPFADGTHTGTRQADLKARIKAEMERAAK